MNLKKAFSFFAGLTLLLLVLSCENTLVTSVDSEIIANEDNSSVSASNKGSLNISLSNNLSRTILPSISMEVESYEITGSGPDDESFSETSLVDSSLSLEGLVNGLWTVSVTAKNNESKAIGHGETTVMVISNETVDALITVVPFVGIGNLALNLSWPEDMVQMAEIESSLSPVNGTAYNLDFEIGSGAASCTLSDIESGFYTLTLKLLDNGVLTMGTVEIVRIVAGETTNGNINFDNINAAEGDITVNIEQEMENPLEVEILGGSETKLESENQKLSAVVNNSDVNVVYVWYVNGNAVDTGDNYKFDKNWEAGFYNINVVAYTTDGERAGSATHQVEVIEESTEGQLTTVISFVVIR